VDKPAQTGRQAADLDHCAHGGPEFRTLMRTMIGTGHIVPVLCRYDAGLAGGTHRSNQSTTAPIALAKRHCQIRTSGLTTFASVPWNAPYYSRCGFRILDDAELTPGLRAIRQREAELDLDKWLRVCMRRDQ
jgi:hypothetical protein